MRPTPCPTERSDSHSVSINAPVAFVWTTLARVDSWPVFSPFALAARATSATTWTVTSPQGEVTLHTHFHEELGLLDHTVALRDGTEVFIPYRVTPNHLGSQLIMINVKSPGDTDEEWAEQLDWMRQELTGAKHHVEQLYSALPDCRGAEPAS